MYKERIYGALNLEAKQLMKADDSANLVFNQSTIWKTVKKIMIPNYVFTKSPNESEYNVLRRNYTVQDPVPLRSSCQSLKTGRSKSKVKSVNLGMKRPKQPRKGTRGVGNFTPTITKDCSTRSVSFRLGAGAITGNSRPQTPRNCKMDSAAQTLSMHTDPSHNAHCELQDSFTDFFSIIHDNVMESVKEAVQRMVTKCFEQSLAKIEQLSQEIRNQEALFNKLHRDLTSKMADQNETNLNQFKFVTQMLIDNQTVHYRALNQAKCNKHRRLEERELEKEKKLEREGKPSGCTTKSRSSSVRSKRFSSGESKQAEYQGPQYMLSQQQQPLVYQISDQIRTNPPLLQKQLASNSMPDISGSPSKPPSGVPKRFGSRSYGNKPDRGVCHPAMTYPPCAIPRRRFLQTDQGNVKEK